MIITLGIHITHNPYISTRLIARKSLARRVLKYIAFERSAIIDEYLMQSCALLLYMQSRKAPKDLVAICDAEMHTSFAILTLGLIYIWHHILQTKIQIIADKLYTRAITATKLCLAVKVVPIARKCSSGYCANALFMDIIMPFDKILLIKSTLILNLGLETKNFFFFV